MGNRFPHTERGQDTRENSKTNEEINKVSQEAKNTLKQNLTLGTNRKDSSISKPKEMVSYDENTVFLVNNSKASQSKIIFFMNGEVPPMEKTPV